MTDLSTKEFELAAQEMAMHVALCVCTEYISSWGTTDFLCKISEYVDDPDLEDVIAFLKNRTGGNHD